MLVGLAVGVAVVGKGVGADDVVGMIDGADDIVGEIVGGVGVGANDVVGASVASAANVSATPSGPA